MNSVTASCSFRCDTDMNMHEDIRDNEELELEEHGDNKVKCIGSTSTISADSSENISDQSSQLQTKDNGYRKNSSLSTSAVKPASLLKPSLPSKPPVAPKPFTMVKPSTVINAKTLQTMKPSDPSKENLPAAGDNTPKSSSVTHYFEDKIAKANITDGILSPSEQQTDYTLNLSNKNDMSCERNSHLDLAEGAVSNINMNTFSVSFHHPVRPAPRRPPVSSPGSGIVEASCVKNQHPLPQDFSTLASSNGMSAVKNVPKRQSPGGQSSNTLIMRRLTQPMIPSRAESPPRQSVRPISFPSAPRRPPPRPASYVLFSPQDKKIGEFLFN